jgi:uncharacterized protein (TIGR02145 family)
MNKLFTLAGLRLCAVVCANAQPMTVRATVSAGSTVNNVYAAIGQPFYEQIAGSGVELAYSVAQAQLDVVNVADETCENVAYTGNGFDIPTSELTVGTTDYERYDNHVPAYGYDRITKLALSVWPTFATADTVMYHGELPLIPGSELQDGVDYQVHEGVNIINYSSEHHCDSVVTLYVSRCPITVKDADSNLYYTVVLGDYCWTQSNLRTTHYFGDAHEEVPVALIYDHDYLDAATMESVFGRLYTWYSAVNIPEGSDSQPALDEDGFVRGICPGGWHIPVIPEIEALSDYTSDELRTLDYWISGAGANSSDFSLTPAGIYKTALGRFEGLLTMTRIWYVAVAGEPAALCSEYYCDTFVPMSIVSYDGYSVRCVKNY